MALAFPRKRSAVLGLILVALAANQAPADEPKGKSEWSTVAGKIVWGGEVPQRKFINVGPAGLPRPLNIPPLDETWIVHPENKGLKNAFVWLAPKDPKDPTARLPIHPALRAVKPKEVVIDCVACMFVPHAVAIREGQDVIARNSAPWAHNFKYAGNPGRMTASGNVLLPPGSQKEVKGLVADRLPIAVECNCYPWMKGWIRVFDHPYFAVTDENGAFEIRNAPIGDFRLMIWHGSGGWLSGVQGREGRLVEIRGPVTKLESIAYPPP